MTTRQDYDGPHLHRESIAPTPLHQTFRWFREAVRRQQEIGDVVEPGALSIATVGADGMPSQRVVLMRFLDENGPGFTTQSSSRKSVDLSGNPRIAGSLTWLPLYRAIHFRGTAERIDDERVRDYWDSRPRDAKISAVASRQSEPIGSRAELDRRHQEALAQFDGTDDIPMPDDFIGWRIRPTEVEFWSGRTNRLHDRLLFSQPGHLTMGDPGWKVTRLQP